MTVDEFIEEVAKHVSRATLDISYIENRVREVANGNCNWNSEKAMLLDIADRAQEMYYGSFDFQQRILRLQQRRIQKGNEGK